MKYSGASEGRWGTYGVEMETVGMVMLNFKHRGKLAYFAEQKRLRLRERACRGEMQIGNAFKRIFALTVQEDRITKEEEKKLRMIRGPSMERAR